MGNWEDAFSIAPPKVADFSGFMANQRAKQARAQLSMSGGYDPYAAAPSNWMAAMTKPKPISGYQPPPFPQALNVEFPWSPSGDVKPVAAVDTTGDFLGSLGASLQNSVGKGGYVNLSNAIPWAEERFLVAAKEFANQAEGGKSLTGSAVDGFATVVKGVAEPVSKVMEFLPNTVRDTSLNTRMEAYKALVSGKPMGSTVGTTLFGPGIEGIAVYAVQDALAKGGAGAAQARDIIAKAIDLPESVKRAIEQNPDGDLASYLDKAPEGRNFTYAPGLYGAGVNLVSIGALYGAEMIATSGLSGALQGAAGVGKVASVLGAVGKGASVMAKAQRLMLASGISYFGASTLTDAILRTMGNKAGVAYLDQINRTALVSDSPAVQLVSSFTVDPIGAAKAALKGELKMAFGAPSIVIDKVLGTRLSRQFTSDNIVFDRLALMYNIPKSQVGDLIGPGLAYETKGDAYNQVLRLAAHTVADRLSPEAKAALNTLPRDQITKALFEQHLPEILREVDAPAGLVNQFRRDWQNHDFYGNFDPEIAKVVTRDYHEAELKTAQAMAAQDLVVGRVDLLNPEGQALVKDAIEATFADGRQGTLRDLNMLSAKHPALDGLVKDLVAKGENGKPFVKPTDLVPREVFDEALKRATDEYATKFRENPIRAATGVDPILRPGVHLADWAAAVDTTEATITALTTATRTPAGDGLIADFVRQKGLLADGEIASADPAALQAQAVEWLNKTTEPWVKRGEDVAAIEAELGKAADRLAEVTKRRLAAEETMALTRRRALPAVSAEEMSAAEAEVAKYRRSAPSPERSAAYRNLRELRAREAAHGVSADQYAAAKEAVGASSTELSAAEAEVAKFRNLMSDVRDPIVPFSSGVKSATRADSAVMVAARRKVAAMERVAAIRAAREELAPAQLVAGADLLHSVVQNADGAWQWAADARVTSGTLFDAAVARFNAWRFSPTYQVRGKIKGTTRTRGQTEASRNFNAQPAEFRAAEMADSPGFLKSLRDASDTVASVPEVGAVGAPALPVTYGEIADMIEAAKSGRKVATEISPAMMDALGTATREDFIAKLGSLRGAYDAALDGKTEYALGRTAGIKVPDWAVERAKTGQIASVFRDPVAEANYGNAVASLKDALDGADTFAAVRDIVEGNPLLRAQAAEVALRNGEMVGDFLANRTNAEAIRTLIPAALPERYVPGVPKAMTALDQAVLADSTSQLADLKIDLEAIRGQLAPPLRDVPIEAVDALASAPRVSVTLADDLNAAGVHWQTLIPESLWAKSPVGAKTLSVILHGDFVHVPQTVSGLLSTLKEIENGNAANMGVGTQLAAEAQHLGQEVVQSMIGDARRAGLEIGVLGMGKGLNPDTWSEDTTRMILKLFEQNRAAGGGMLMFRDEMGLQYGLKARSRGKINPKTGVREGEAVALDMASVPGLAEELLTKHYQPWSERMGTAKIREGFNYLFGPRSNQSTTFAARGRFEERLAKYGVSAADAQAIWSDWKDFAFKSRETRDVFNKKTGEYVTQPGQGALYATEKNIPNWELDARARATLEKNYAEAGGVPRALRQIKYSEEMRIAGSDLRRLLESGGVVRRVATKVGVPDLPLGEVLQKTYGALMHNSWVTTKYFMFRFGLDTRFHAMNKVESFFLYYGRAGLKTAEIDEGMFGMTKEAIVRGEGMDPMLNTGYPFSITRDAGMLKTFLKEQPDALRAFAKANPDLIEKAVRNIAETDPELSATIRAMGHTTDDYMRIMDSYYSKILGSSDPGSVAVAEVMKDLVNNPELEEVYGRIAQVNKDLLDSVRDTFYGNPNRSQVERWANNYLLYWPISYQIKATKWLLHIMYGKIGGIQTGGLGAYALDQMMIEHEKRLVSDPEYGNWFLKHQTLVFAAQMMVPITPGSLGVSLSPPLRDIFFGSNKSVATIGPVYTLTKFLPQLAGDLYPDIKDIPGLGTAANIAYSAIKGQAPPSSKAPAPVGWKPLPAP